MSEAKRFSALEAGAANCALDCAGVREDQRVFVVSQTGAVEEPVVAAVVEAAEAAGARVETVWADPIPKSAPEEIPTPVLKAYRDGDVVISHFPSLKREALFAHFQAETRVRVPNRARTADLLASDWARFPYRVQKAIATRLDRWMVPGRPWRITSPAGTDVEGVFGAAGGEVGAAYFVEAGEEGRARRNFPGGVHSPHTCVGINGVIVAEYVDNVARGTGDEPLCITVRDGRLVDVTGGDAEGRARAALAATDGYIDSWHAGVNPRTVVPVARAENGREWFSYSHCSPEILHFHLGRTHATTNVACFSQTLTVDGETLYQDGGLAMLGDDAVARAVAESGITDDMLANRAVPFD